MKQPKIYELFVIQVGDNPKDVYVGQTAERVDAILERYKSKPEHAPKNLRGKKLALRADLSEGYPSFSSQESARRYEVLLAEKLEGQGYKIFSKSLSRKLGGRSFGMRVRGKHIVAAAEQRTGDYRNEALSKSVAKDLFAYGRKKSHEWNDESAEAFQRSLLEKIQRNRIDRES